MSTADAAKSRFFVLASRTAREAMEVAAAACSVSVNEIAAGGRARASVAYARQIAMYLAHVVGQMSLSEISLVFNRDRTTVAHACHATEDRRDSAIFDQQIEALETEMRGGMNALLEEQNMSASVERSDVMSARRDLSGEPRPASRRRPGAKRGRLT
jgi:hypothetical protein